MEPFVGPRRVCPGAQEGPVRHKRTELQSLCIENGNKSRTRYSRSYRREETPLRHLGQYRQRRVQDGEHWQGRPYTGVRKKIIFRLGNEEKRIYFFNFGETLRNFRNKA